MFGNRFKKSYGSSRTSEMRDMRKIGKIGEDAQRQK